MPPLRGVRLLLNPPSARAHLHVPVSGRQRPLTGFRRWVWGMAARVTETALRPEREGQGVHARGSFSRSFLNRLALATSFQLLHYFARRSLDEDHVRHPLVIIVAQMLRKLRSHGVSLPFCGEVEPSI